MRKTNLLLLLLIAINIPNVSFGGDVVRVSRISHTYGKQSTLSSMPIVHDVENKEQVKSIIKDLDADKRYLMQVQAINSSGISNSRIVAIGTNVVPELNLQVMKTANSLGYRFKLSNIDFTNVVVTSAKIYDYYGNLKMTLPNEINTYFDISSLSQGIYIIKVDVVGYGMTSNLFFN